MCLSASFVDGATSGSLCTGNVHVGAVLLIAGSPSVLLTVISVRLPPFLPVRPLGAAISCKFGLCIAPRRQLVFALTFYDSSGDSQIVDDGLSWLFDQIVNTHNMHRTEKQSVLILLAGLLQFEGHVKCQGR